MTETPPAHQAPAGPEPAGYSADPSDGAPGYSANPGPATPGYPGSGATGYPAYPGYGTPGYLAYPGDPASGYSAYPGYPAYPAAGWRAGGSPAPGCVPLRPLGFGEILSGAFSLVRQNPKATLGLTASIVTALATSLALILLIASQTTAAVGLLAVPAGLALYGLQLGGLTVAMGRGLLGRKLGLREALAASYAWRVMLTVLVLAVAVVVPWWLLLVTLKGWGVLVALLLTAWLSVMASLTIPVVVLEGRWPFPALARSWRLVLGSYWRLVGIYLLTYLVTLMLSFVITIPIELGGALAGAASTSAVGHAAAFLTLGVVVIGEIVVVSLTSTIQTGVLVLVYADLRMRKEGMDLVLQQAAHDGRLSGEEFATTRPGAAYAGGAYADDPYAGGV